MKKRILLALVASIVILIGMSSSLFASNTTFSFDYFFRNDDPWIGTSFAASYLNSIRGNSVVRQVTVYVRVQQKNGTWATVTRSYMIPPEAISGSWEIKKYSDSTMPITSIHMASVNDFTSRPCTVVWTMGVGGQRGTAVPVDY